MQYNFVFLFTLHIVLFYIINNQTAGKQLTHKKSQYILVRSVNASAGIYVHTYVYSYIHMSILYLCTDRHEPVKIGSVADFTWTD